MTSALFRVGHLSSMNVHHDLQCVVTELKGVLWNICQIHILSNLYLNFQSSLLVIYSIIL